MPFGFFTASGTPINYRHTTRGNGGLGQRGLCLFVLRRATEQKKLNKSERKPLAVSPLPFRHAEVTLSIINWERVPCSSTLHQKGGGHQNTATARLGQG